MAEVTTLDVTQIEPKLKHPTIFQHFDALQEGEAFVIHNDHDPKPLYYQLLGERGSIFNWDYLEQGPQWWRVKIVKKKLSTGEETVGEIAGKDLRKAEVFKKFGLEFCCDGKKSLKESCEDAGVPVETVTRALESLRKENIPASRDYNSWKLDFLADYIVNIHHKYVEDSLPVLTGLSEKIAEHHGEVHPELYEIKKHVDALLAEMQSHQIKEEKILFPFIHQMVQCEREGKSFDNPPFGTIESPVKMMLEDHDVAGEHIHAIERLSQNYLVPADGCESYRLYYHKLHEFDEDLHQHLHLENNILFPKAIKLEKKLAN
jgi:regulator of cell morphogenesis and NO signaling